MYISTSELALDALHAKALQRTEDEVASLWSALALQLTELGYAAEVFKAPLAAVFPALDGRLILTLDVTQRVVGLDRRSRSRVGVVRGDEQAREWIAQMHLPEVLGLSSDGEETTFIAVSSTHLDALASHPSPTSQSTAKAVRENPSQKTQSPWDVVRRIMSPEKPDVLVVLVYAIGIGILSLTLPIAVQVLVNTVAFGTLLQPILVLSALVGAGLVLAAGLRALQTWVVEVIQRRLFVRLTAALGQRLPRVQITAFETGQGPELLNRFFDIFTAQKATSAILVGGVEALLTSLVGLLVLSFYHPILLGFGLVLVGAVAVVFWLLGKNAASTTIEESYAKYAVAGWLEEMVRHLFMLKTPGGAVMATNRLNELAAHWLRARDAHFRIFFRQFVGTLVLQVVVSVALLAIGGWLVVERELTIGQLVAAELIVSAVVASISKLGNKLETVYDLVAAADKLGTLLELPLEREHGERRTPLRGPVSVQLDSVHSRSGTLRELDLHVPAGTSALVRGNSRSRNDLVDLLFAFEEPAHGAVRIEGYNLRDLDLVSARQSTSVVRDAEIFPGSIADNVRAFAPELAASEVWKLLERVGLAEEVRALPGGLRTELAPSGLPLDGEGKLRLTLARALASRPGLLILDGVLSRFSPRAAEQLAGLAAEGRTLIVLDHPELPAPGVPGLVDRSLAA